MGFGRGIAEPFPPPYSLDGPSSHAARPMRYPAAVRHSILPWCALFVALAACRAASTESVDPSTRLVLAGQRIEVGATVLAWPDASEPVDVLEAGGTFAIDTIVLDGGEGGTAEAALRELDTPSGVHFVIDVDGTVFQVRDASSSSRSIGILLAGTGAVRPREAARLDAWYERDARGLRMALPTEETGRDARLASFVARPARGPVTGVVNGYTLKQYDYTAEQYAALVELTAALCRTFPRVLPDAPRDRRGFLIDGVLAPDHRERFRGVLGRAHLDARATGPGPAFDWEAFVRRLRAELAAR